jgi:GNAT superfamily N-acetyltransferase
MKLEIANLADHPQHLLTLADWFASEWGGRDYTASLKRFTERLEGRMNRDHPPITILGFLQNELVGTAAIKIQEMETHPQYKYWLGSVYVREEYRGRGIASELIKAVIEKASQLSIDKLYLYTRGKVPLYTKFCWKTIEETNYRGKVTYIMERSVSE